MCLLLHKTVVIRLYSLNINIYTLVTSLLEFLTQLTFIFYKFLCVYWLMLPMKYWKAIECCIGSRYSGLGLRLKVFIIYRCFFLSVSYFHFAPLFKSLVCHQNTRSRLCLKWWLLLYKLMLYSRCSRLLVLFPSH